jgi:cobalt-zinc-cadmium efflux system protein
MAAHDSYLFNHRFLLGIALNASFVIVEVFYGFRANSVALIADAVHNAADVFGLCLIWFSYFMARRDAPHHFTYGYKNATIFAAFLNVIVIFVAVGNLIWSSLERFSHTEYVTSKTMIIVAAGGVVINGLTALMFMRDRHKDINILGVFINMGMDAAVSLAVVVAGVCIYYESWYWLDPTMGLVIAVAIIYGSWGLFKESINLIFQAVPAAINLQEIKHDIEAIKNIISYHDLHVWPLSTTDTALSVHIVVKAADFNPRLVHMLSDDFRDKYGIHHATIQIEIEGSNESCQMEC